MFRLLFPPRLGYEPPSMTGPATPAPARATSRPLPESSRPAAPILVSEPRGGDEGPSGPGDVRNDPTRDEPTRPGTTVPGSLGNLRKIELRQDDPSVRGCGKPWQGFVLDVRPHRLTDACESHAVETQRALEAGVRRPVGRRGSPDGRLQGGGGP